MICPPTAGYYDMIVLPHKPKVANTRGSAFIGRGADNPMYAPVELRDDSHGYIYFSPECIAKYNGLTVGIRMEFSYTIE